MFSFITAMLAVLSLTVLPAFAADSVQPLLLERSVPFIYATELYNNNTYDWNLIYTDSSYDLFLGVVNNQVVAGSKHDISYTYIFNGTSTTTSLDRGTSIDGTTFWFSYVRFTGTINSSIPVFSSVSEFANACYYYVPETPSEAVLVSPGDDYQYLTSKTLSNSSSSSVAVGWVGDTFYVSSLDPNVTLQNIETTFYLRLFDTDTQLYYSISGLVGTEEDIIGPVFESTSDYFSSALEVLTGTGTSTAVSGTSQTFTLAPGYVGYLHLADPTADINLSANFNTYSKLGVSGSAWDANITYLFGTTLPYGSREFPRSEASYVYWMKNAGGSTNLLGQTKSGGAVLHPTGNLIEIYNPYYQQSGLGNEDDGNGSVVLNPTIYGETTGGIMSWVVYPVEDNFSSSNFAGVVSSSKSNFADPTPASDDGNGNFDPHVTPGGDNDPVNDDTVQGILNSFLNRFFGLFSSGHAAIRSLIDGSSEFVSQLSGLYAWLPAPVLSVLTSAIVLAITIGVLKVLL